MKWYATIYNSDDSVHKSRSELAISDENEYVVRRYLDDVNIISASHLGRKFILIGPDDRVQGVFTFVTT